MIQKSTINKNVFYVVQNTEVDGQVLEGGWYFWDEVGQVCYANPCPTEEAAIIAFDEYCKSLTLDPFYSVQQFTAALQSEANREFAIRKLMQRQVDEWLNDGSDEVIRVLTLWAMDKLELSDDTLIGMAEKYCDN